MYCSIAEIASQALRHGRRSIQLGRLETGWIRAAFAEFRRGHTFRLGDCGRAASMADPGRRRDYGAILEGGPATQVQEGADQKVDNLDTTLPAPKWADRIDACDASARMQRRLQEALSR